MIWNTRNKADEESAEKVERAEKKRKRGASGVKIFLFALLLGAALAFCAVGYLNSLQVNAPTITSSMLKEELKYVKDLVTVEYRYTNAGKAEFPRYKNIPFTDKSFIAIYDGVIKYGVDLSAVEIRVNEMERTVTVTIPASKLISHEIDEKSFQALDEKNGLFNQISIDDVTEFRQAQKDEMEAKAVARGLPSQAQEQCGTAIEALLRATPGMEAYELEIRKL